MRIATSYHSKVPLANIKYINQTPITVPRSTNEKNVARLMRDSASGGIPEEVRNTREDALFARTARTLPTIEASSVRVDTLSKKIAQIEERRSAGLGWVKQTWRFGGYMVAAFAAVGFFFLVQKISLNFVAEPATSWKFAVLVTGMVLSMIAIIAMSPEYGFKTAKEETFELIGSRIPGREVSKEKSEMPKGELINIDLGMDPEPEAATTSTRTTDFFESRLGVTKERMLSTGGGNAAPPRLRKYFPETLLWKPELITDEQGRVFIDIELADSITSWRLSASGVNSQGQLGSWQSDLVVFQPFFIDLNLPVRLTRGDEVTVPVVVSNYLKTPQKVQVSLKKADWFEQVDGANQEVELAANEVKAVNYRIRVTKVGRQSFEIFGSTGSVADAVKRSIEVVPDGRRVEEVVNGSLTEPVAMSFNLPKEAIEGSAKLIVKFYPSGFSQLVEGLDSIFQMPNGCFEQTSSSTYPNILALDYLKRMNKSMPPLEAKARQYIHIGYQRLLNFEVPGGGFDWYGRSPANRSLTAYGLMEFRDMARVHTVDPQLIERTRSWLLRQRQGDGSWEPDSWHPEHRHVSPQGQVDTAKVMTTAYIAWAVFGGSDKNDASPTRKFLSAVPAKSLSDPYLLALMANALLALEENDAAKTFLDRLDEVKQQSKDGDQMWWGLKSTDRTAFHGSGQSGDIEVTALVVLAKLQAKQSPASVKPSLNWLAKQRDSRGTWHSTQATILTLKALLAGSTPGGDAVERKIELVMGDPVKKEIVIPADQSEVMQQLDLSSFLAPGVQKVEIKESTSGATSFQAAFRYHVPVVEGPAAVNPLQVLLNYDREQARVGEEITVSAKVVNCMTNDSPMVMVELPVPAGFAANTEVFSTLARSGKIGKFQMQPDRILLYLRGLNALESFDVQYKLRANLPVKVTATGAKVYEYYDPSKQGTSPAKRLEVLK